MDQYRLSTLGYPAVTSAAETFVVALARASKRAAKYMRELSKDDKDDVLSTALLWCWENQKSYDPKISLDLWFVGAIRDALKKWRLGESRQACELQAEIPVQDDTSARAETLQVVEQIRTKLTAKERRIAVYQCKGYSRDEIMETMHVSKRTVDAGRKRIAALVGLLPGPSMGRPASSTPQADSEGPAEMAGIDREIERLEHSPSPGADCIPCWRCRWFDGFLPDGRRSVRMDIVEPDVRAAVSNTEARKITIANEVRS